MEIWDIKKKAGEDVGAAMTAEEISAVRNKKSRKCD